MIRRFDCILCKTDILIKDNNADNIKKGNTVPCDEFTVKKFDHILSNLPFGREWKNEKTSVERETKLG